MERKHPLVIDRSAETGGDTREAAFNKVDKELDNIIGSANSIKEELGALAAEVEAMEPVDTSSFAKKTEIPKIVSGSGIRVVVTGQENKISADIPIASGIESGLMSSADKISLDGLKAQEPIFEGHIVDPDKHLPEILAADTGKVLEATSTGAKWTTPASGGVTSLNGKLGALSMSGAGIASVTTGSNYITVNVPAPNFPVKSVNGKYGDVVLAPTDIGAAPTIHTHDFPVTSVNGQTGDVIISAGGGGEPGGFKFWESGEYPIFWGAFTTVDLDFEIEHPERCICTAQVKYIGPDGKITYWNQGDIALSAISSNAGTTFPLEPLIGSKTIKLWSGNNGLRLHHPRNSGHISLVSTTGSVFHFDNFRYLFKLWYV